MLERGSGSGPHTRSSSKSSVVEFTGRRESKLEHPVFSWQKKKQETPATTSKEMEVQVSITSSTSSIQLHQLTEETAESRTPHQTTDSTKCSYSVIEQSIQEAHQPNSQKKLKKRGQKESWRILLKKSGRTVVKQSGRRVGKGRQ